MKIITKLFALATTALTVLGCGQPAGPAPDPPNTPPPQPPTTTAATAATLTLESIFPTNRVLDVRITLAKEDWDTIRYQSRNLFEALREQRKYGPIDGPYTYVNASVTIDGVEFPKIGLRKKGFIGSQSSSRPSLKVKLNHVDKKGGIDGLTNLTLNNNHQDPSVVKQFMGYALFNAAGSPAPRCAFANVTVNGKHLGVYSHVETMRKPFIKRAFGNDNGILYEGTVVDFHEGWEGSFENKFGKDKVGREKIQELINAMRGEPDGKDYEQAIGKLVDLDSFYTFWAVEGLLGFWDGYSGNGNNYHAYLNPGTWKFHFLPWGADAVFEKFSKIGYDPEAPISVKTKGMIAHKLYQTTSGRERYAKTLTNLLTDHWNETDLLAETDRIEAMLEPYLAPSQSKQRRSLDQVRKFIRSRRADIVAEISDGMPVWTRAPKPPPVIPGYVKAGADRNSIWSVAKRGDIDELKKQLENGADANARDEKGITALSWAAMAGRVEAVELLVKEGANVDARNRDGAASLHSAAFFGHPDIVELLIKNGADVNAKNTRGETPLGTVATDWNDRTEGILRFIATLLTIDVDMEQIEAARPKVAAMLREHGGKTGAELR